MQIYIQVYIFKKNYCLDIKPFITWVYIYIYKSKISKHRLGPITAICIINLKLALLSGEIHIAPGFSSHNLSSEWNIMEYIIFYPIFIPCPHHLYGKILKKLQCFILFHPFSTWISFKDAAKKPENPRWSSTDSTTKSLGLVARPRAPHPGRFEAQPCRELRRRRKYGPAIERLRKWENQDFFWEIQSHSLKLNTWRH